MKKYLAASCYFFFVCIASSFCQDIKQLQETAKTFMFQGDYSNAILVLNRARQVQPDNLEVIKDLAYNYYLQREYSNALEIIKPVLDRDDVDDQCYQIAGNIYQGLEQYKDCEKVYKKGLKKFPASGALYSEYGQLLWSQQDYGAIKQWEKGIETDPDYSMNYYNATRFYYLSTDKVWSIIYAEIFINMEPLGRNTPEIKNILLESYKKLFSDADLMKNNKDKNKFSEAFLKCMSKQSSITALGLNPESLTMIRTRFVLDWFRDYSDKFPFRLFELHRQLLQEGMFDAYNQWIFGATQNLPAYQNWTTTHSADYNEFLRFQKSRVFKLPIKQYYR